MRNIRFAQYSILNWVITKNMELKNLRNDAYLLVRVNGIFFVQAERCCPNVFSQKKISNYGPSEVHEFSSVKLLQRNFFSKTSSAKLLQQNLFSQTSSANVFSMLLLLLNWSKRKPRQSENCREIQEKCLWIQEKCLWIQEKCLEHRKKCLEHWKKCPECQEKYLEHQEKCL